MEYIPIIESPSLAIRSLIEIIINNERNESDLLKFDELLIDLYNWTYNQNLNNRLNFIKRITKFYYYLRLTYSIERNEIVNVLLNKIEYYISFNNGYYLYMSNLDKTPMFSNDIIQIKEFVFRYLDANESINYLKRLNFIVQQTNTKYQRDFMIDVRNLYYDYKEFYFEVKQVYSQKQRNRLISDNLKEDIYPYYLIVVVNDSYASIFKKLHEKLLLHETHLIDCDFEIFWQTFKGTEKFNWLGSASDFIFLIEKLEELKLINIPRKGKKKLINKVIESGNQFLHKSKTFKNLAKVKSSRFNHSGQIGVFPSTKTIAFLKRVIKEINVGLNLNH
jgi:hypothetical protein